MSQGSRVEVDTSDLQRYTRRFAAGLDNGGNDVARRQAGVTANAIRAGVPVRTGRLAATVRPVADGKGWAVAYGGGLKYAASSEKRSHAARNALSGVDRTFTRACLTMATHEAGTA